MKLNTNIVRQGDVVFVRVDKRPSWAREAAPRDGMVIAEFGESSGHLHALRDSGVVGFRATDPTNAALAGLDYIEVGGSEPATMRHEFADGRPAEHEPVSLAPGLWERPIQVEYDPDEERRIAD